jgi:flavin reductase (DIM6/NTAB) family NADH-FMN oxidoreductase RutF
MIDNGEMLRQAMRRWTAGVCIVTGSDGSRVHGMTVNSFTSVSLNPQLITVTLGNRTRTFGIVKATEVFAVTILAYHQLEIADRFAGKVPESENRFEGLKTFTLVSGAPLLEGGLAHLDCKVVHIYPMPESTLFVGEVLAIQFTDRDEPLLYTNRTYHRLMI